MNHFNEESYLLNINEDVTQNNPRLKRLNNWYNYSSTLDISNLSCDKIKTTICILLSVSTISFFYFFKCIP
jgi:hypothetical protein